MGRKQVTLTATGSLSNHNSEEDVVDAADWSAFCNEVTELIHQWRFGNLDIMLSEG